MNSGTNGVAYDQRHHQQPPPVSYQVSEHPPPMAKDDLEVKQEPEAHRGFVLLPFHNPFDMNLYPITNPPIFDSTMNLPYDINDGGNRRRRISISNGQIGQIINHEAIFDYDLGVAEFDLKQSLAPAPAPVAPAYPQKQFYPNRYPAPQPAPAQAPPQPPQPQMPMPVSQAPPVPSSAPPPAQAQAPPSDKRFNEAAGVPPPNHQLIYNDEVIYNPNNGPIPGTAAWKKERLLERNRVAASKCRQRKKQAQLELQNSVSKIEHQLNAERLRANRYRDVVKTYDEALALYFETKDASHLDKLRELASKDINDK